MVHMTCQTQTVLRLWVSFKQRALPPDLQNAELGKVTELRDVVVRKV